MEIKKFIIFLLVILFWNSVSFSKDLFEYLKSNQPPPLILGHTDFDKALNKEISDCCESDDVNGAWSEQIRSCPR